MSITLLWPKSGALRTLCGITGLSNVLSSEEVVRWLPVWLSFVLLLSHCS